MAIKIPVEDRVSTFPGRVELIPVAGQTNMYDMSRADEPVQEGTPLNKALLDQKAYTLTEDTVVHVSPSGSDADGDGSSIAPFATIQAAVDALPKLLGGHIATINIADGIYEERILVDGFSGGRLRIGEIGRSVVVRGISVTNSNHVALNVSNVTWTSGFSGAIVSIGYNSAVALESDMIVNCAGTDEVGVYVNYGSELVGTDCTLTVMNCAQSAIVITAGSRAAFDALAGSNNTEHGVVAECGGTVSYTTTNLSSTLGDVTRTGGLTRVGDGHVYATIPATAWSEDGDFSSCAITVDGILADGVPIIDLSLDNVTSVETLSELNDVWGNLLKCKVLSRNSLYFVMTETPEIDIPIVVKVV